MAKLRVLSFLLYASLLIARGASQAEPAGQDLSEDGNVPLIVQRIEGRVQVERLSSDEWVSETKVVVDGGRFYGFLRSNGEFEIHNVPPGSYLVEVVSPNHAFDPVRVDISSKSGKIRARKVNMLKASSVTHVPYPLRFKAEGQAEFFEKREKWNVLSTLKNPMIWLMIGPMLIMLAMPKLMKSLGPESQKEMQESMNMFNQGSSMPSLEEMFTNMFGGGGGGGGATAAAAKKPKAITKRSGSRR